MTTATQTPGLSPGPQADTDATRAGVLPTPVRTAETSTRGVADRVLAAVGPVTGTGRTVAAIAALALVIGLLGGWQEWFVIAAAAASALLAALVFLVGGQRYRVTVAVAEKRVTVGEPAFASVTVAHAGRRRSLPIRMEVPVGRGIVEESVPSLSAGSEHHLDLDIPTRRRAVLDVGPARSVRGDAFGLVRRVVTWSEPVKIYVHPRTVRLQGSSLGVLNDLEGRPTSDLSSSDISFHALREYVPGDDLRHVHWKSTARNNTMLVRQFEQTKRSHLVIAVSCREGDYGSAEEFETAVSAAASLALQAARESRPFSVLTRATVLAAATGRAVLDRLAAIEIAPDAPPVQALAHTAAALVPQASIAVVLCGSGPEPARIRAAGHAFPLGIRTMAVRAVDGAAGSTRRFGGTDVLTIGTLDDLGRAVRAVRP